MNGCRPIPNDVLEAMLRVLAGLRSGRSGAGYPGWRASDLDYGIVRRWRFGPEAAALEVFEEIMNPVQLVDETEGGEQDG